MHICRIADTFNVRLAALCERVSGLLTGHLHAVSTLRQDTLILSPSVPLACRSSTHIEHHQRHTGNALSSQYRQCKHDTIDCIQIINIQAGVFLSPGLWNSQITLSFVPLSFVAIEMAAWQWKTESPPVLTGRTD